MMGRGMSEDADLTRNVDDRDRVAIPVWVLEPLVRRILKSIGQTAVPTTRDYWLFEATARKPLRQ